MIRIIASALVLISLTFVHFGPYDLWAFFWIALAGSALLAIENIVRKPVGHSVFRRIVSVCVLGGFAATYVSSTSGSEYGMVYLLVILCAGTVLAIDNLWCGIKAMRAKRATDTR